MRSPVYLDHAATSLIRPEALEEFLAAAAIPGNPAAIHRLGQRAKARLEEAREELAEAVGAQASEVIFTSGGSEANSLAVLGTWHAGRAQGRQRCLISAVEHPSVAQATASGAEVLPVNSCGLLETAQIEDRFDSTVAVCSAMTVNNETGIIQDLTAVAELTAQHGAYLHTDAVQALGHVPVDFAASPADLLSLSAHKIGGPVGIGALLARRTVDLAPIGLGGGQERQLRSGTVPVALAAAFARAASLAVAEQAMLHHKLVDLRDQICSLVQAAGGRLNSSPGGASHIVNVTFPGARADDLLLILDQQGIHASVGSACKAGVHQPSEVLLAMGRSLDEAGQSLRFSLGHTSQQSDVDALAAVLPGAVAAAQQAFA